MVNMSVKSQSEGVVKQIQAQLLELNQTNFKKIDEEEMEKRAREKAYVKTQVEKIENVLKSGTIPPPLTSPRTSTRYTYLNWSSSKNGGSSSLSSGWENPVTKLSNALGFSGSMSPKSLSRQPSMVRQSSTLRQSLTTKQPTMSMMSMESVRQNKIHEDYFKQKLEQEAMLEERKDEENSGGGSSGNVGSNGGRNGGRSDGRSDGRENSDGGEDGRDGRSTSRGRQRYRSPIVHSSSRYLRTSLDPVRAKSPILMSLRSKSPIPSSRNPSRSTTPNTPTNQSLLWRVSPFSNRSVPTTPSSQAKTDSTFSTEDGLYKDMSLSSFPKSKLTVKRMSSSMVHRRETLKAE